MSVSPTDELVFRYTAVDRTGRQVRDVVRARDTRAAARALASEGLTPLSLTEERAKGAGARDRDLNFAERVAVLRQLALMIQAGVGLLEAMQTVAAGVTAAKGRAKLEAAINALKQGDPLAQAMETHASGFPFYVYAMLKVGQATGRIPEVLREAAEQMAYEHKLRREFTGSLIYPAILIFVGVAVVNFMLLGIVPRFSDMIGEDRSGLNAISKTVFGLSDFVRNNFPFMLVVLFALIFGVGAILSNKRFRPRAYNAARGFPMIGGILRARELAAWSRMLGFGLDNGVGLLDAATLARQGAPQGQFSHNLEQFDRDLKAGMEVADSLSRHTELTAMDLSLLRAGQKSGTLARMFLYVAEGYDNLMRDRLKAMSAMIQPVTIVIIAIFVLGIALGVMMAMLSVYQSIET